MDGEGEDDEGRGKSGLGEHVFDQMWVTGSAFQGFCLIIHASEVESRLQSECMNIDEGCFGSFWDLLLQ